MADLSFVVPIYKVPYNFLQQCIDSILGQTYKNIELILVDDGSPDDCGRICDENAQKDNRVVVVHKKNGGLSDARNAGTNVASSPWVTFVDGDDWVEEDFAKSFLDRAHSQEDRAEIYMYNGYRNYSDNEVVCTAYYADGTRFSTYSERENLQKECCLVPTRNNGNQLFIGSGWAKVYNRQHLIKNNLYFQVVPYGEDSIFFMYSVEESSRIEYVAKPVYHYRDTEGGMVNGYRKNADTEQAIYVKALFKFAEIYSKPDSFVRVLYYRVFISMQRTISQKFFNTKNKATLLEKMRMADAYFLQPPFCDVYKNIEYRKLNRSSKIKYIIFRFKIYAALNVFRDLYLSLNKQRSQKRY